MILDKAILPLPAQHEFPFILQALRHLRDFLLGLFDIANTYWPHEFEFFAQHVSSPLRQVAQNLLHEFV